MLQTPTQTNDHDNPTGGLAMVHRLATELAARMRYAQIVEHPLPAEQIQALVEAARLLQERGEPWPQIVGEVLRQVADDLTEDPAAKEVQEAESSRKVGSLNRFLGAFRRDQGPPSKG